MATGLNRGRLTVTGRATPLSACTAPESRSVLSDRRSLRRSLAVWYRSSGSFARQWPTMRARSRGSSFLRSVTDRRRVLDDRGEQRHLRVALERAIADSHLVQHHAQREHVAARVDGLALGLLGRHVGGGAHDAARAREVGGRHRHAHGGLLVLRQLRQAEVQHLDAPVAGDHHVHRLQIAVRDPSLMRRAHGVGEGDGKGQDLVERQPAGRDVCRQRVAVHQLERQEEDAVGFLDRVDGDDVGVVQGGDRPGLALEALPPVAVRGEFRRQDFQRDPASELRVVGEKDLAHAAFAQPFEDAVVPECGADHRFLGVKRRHAGQTGLRRVEMVSQLAQPGLTSPVGRSRARR